MSTKGPVIIYHLGGGGGRRILGDHLIFSRIQGGTTQICLDNARHRGRGKAGGGKAGGGKAGGGHESYQ